MNENTTNMKESLAVYESLRNEIISTQSTRTNLIVYMYTVYVVLLGLGVQQSRIFYVISFIILISFQSKINRSKYTIARISTYIRVFFEDKNEDTNIHWETSNVDKDLADFKNRMGENKIVSIISGTGSVQLGAISTICYIATAIYDRCFNKVNSTFPLAVDVALIFISISCLYALYLLYDDYKVTSKDLEKMETSYAQFKKRVYPKADTCDIKDIPKE